MEKFFDLIYGSLQGQISIVTRDEHGELTDEKWFTYPADLNRMIRYVERRNDEDIYNSVAVFTNAQRSKLDVAAMSHVVYADADTCHPDNFRMPPTIVVQTSPDRYHCYWVLDENVPADKAALASQRIYLAHKDQGCDAGWAVSKLLRVPETTNLKRTEPFKVVAEYYPENIYTLDTFESVYSDVTPKTFEVVSQNIPNPLSHAEFDDLEGVVEDAGLSSLYYERPSDEQSWYELLFRLELDLFREGLNPQQVFWLAEHAACNKYKRDGRSSDDLWKDVQKAYNEFLEDERVEAPHSDGIQQVREDFLSLEERKYIRDNPCFVDEYLAWATSRTDAAEVYHRSLAYMLLSQVFGGRAKLAFQHSVMGLNLWVTIAGDTTLTRKSTAKDMMVKLLHKFEIDAGIPVQIDLGRDTSAEGLVSTLGEEKRDGMPALMVIEEFQEWLHSTMTKNYMAGTLGKFTDLYNGEVPVVLRATAGAGNKLRNETSFSFIGVGIREQIASVLDKKHFASGFLARMLWAVADTPAYNDSFGIIERRSVTGEAASYDPERDRISKKLAKAVRKYKFDKENVIDFSEDAWERFMDWSKKFTKDAYHSPLTTIIYPTSDRMKYSVAKSAALLALYDNSEKIEVSHVLHALAQGELWNRDMTRMAGEISNSDYESKLNEVERYISTGSGGKRKDAAVRRQFARYRASEYEDIIKSLCKQGRVRYDPSNRQILEAL